MVRIITELETRIIDSALRQAYKDLIELGMDESELEDLIEAKKILKGLKQKTIEEFLGEPE